MGVSLKGENLLLWQQIISFKRSPQYWSRLFPSGEALDMGANYFVKEKLPIWEQIISFKRRHLYGSKLFPIGEASNMGANYVL